jgi:hypothetical protein
MTSARPIAKVKFSELLDAFEFVSFGALFEHRAYINANDMDAPTRNGIVCAKVEVLICPLNREERPR